jgi:hypothetical protein
MKKFADEAIIHLAAYQQRFANLCNSLKTIADENPDGFTAKVVLNEVVKINPKKSYIVALGITQNTNSSNVIAIQSDLQKKLQAVYRNENAPQVLVGGWQHEKLYFYDVVLCFENFEVAMGFAKANNQLAIWDCERGQSQYI